MALTVVSCSSLGTRSDLVNQGTVERIHVVGIAPINVDESTLSVCEAAQSVAMDALIDQIEANRPFRVVGVDSLLLHFDEAEPVSPEAILAAAARMKLDAVLFCNLEADLTEDLRWRAAKASIQMVESSTGKLVIITEFNTQWGKSYWGWGQPAPAQQIADAVEGAFDPIVKAWSR
jgi:hypothetical protein